MGRTISRATPRSILIGASAAVLTTAVGVLGAPESAHAATPPRTVPLIDGARTAVDPQTHIVEPGDTVWAIAQRHGLRIADLLAWNGLGEDALIHPGQTLVLRGPNTPPPPAEPPRPITHTITAGDTIFAIAQAHGLSVDAILAANGMRRDSIIYPGQTILIPTADAGDPAPATDPSDATLDAAQAENAALIIRIGRELGVPDRGIAIALATARVESWLRNLDWGDRDSLGLFQQRPSTGWGSPEQILDRERSIRVFYGGPHDPNGSATRGLLDIPGWQDMSFGQAAQAVQISAYPERYGRWESAAYTWLALYG